MRKVPARTVAAVVALGIAAAGLAGCSGSTPKAAASAPQTAFSQTLHDALPEPVRTSGQLTVLTSAGYAPVMFYGPDGHALQGSEADIARALGRVLGVKVAFEPAEFPTILNHLAAGDADIGMAGITDTAERQKKTDFVDYFQAGTSILVQRGNPHGITDLHSLCGHRVSVGEGTTQEALARGLASKCSDEPPVVVPSLNAADAMLELRAGTVDATLVDYPPAVHMANDPKSRAFYQLASESQDDPAPFGIAVSKKRPGLATVVQEALTAMQASGEYDQVLKHWNLTAGRLPKIALNTGS
jgi:polar amino acid transport system substrate-binding protein